MGRDKIARWSVSWAQMGSRVATILIVIAILGLGALPASGQIASSGAWRLDAPVDLPHLTTAGQAAPLAACQTTEVQLSVSGAGEPLVERQPLDVVIVLDRSGSMNDGQNPPQPLTDAKAAAKLLVDELDSTIDRVGLVSYSSTASLDAQLTSNFVEVKSAIGGLSTLGWTNIGGGTHLAQQELSTRGRAGTVKVIVLLSDGAANRTTSGSACATWPTSSTDCTSDAINRAASAKAAGTTVYTIGLNLGGVDAANPGSGAFARSVLRSMASSPANYYESPESSELDGIFADIARVITNVAGADVTLVDILPQGVNYVSGSAHPEPTSVAGQTLIWSLGVVAIGQTHLISFTLSLDSDAPQQRVGEYPASRVDFIDFEGRPVSVALQETLVTVSSCDGVVGDTIYFDNDRSGTQSATEDGIAGVVVRLFTDDREVCDLLVDSRITDVNGRYLFSAVPPGRYCVSVDRDPFTNPMLVGMERTTIPMPMVIDLAPQQVQLDADFGYAGQGFVSGTVYWDWDQDGAQGLGEQGLESVSVCLSRDAGTIGVPDSSDTMIGCQDSDSQGNYSFPGLATGSYLVIQSQPAGLESTTPDLLQVQLVVVGPSGSSVDNDYGEILFASLGDFVFLDADDDGIHDPAESGISGVALHLTGTDLLGQAIDTFLVTVDGAYHGSGLLPGSYTVTAPTTFGGYSLNSPESRSTVLSTSAPEDNTLDFGYVYPTGVAVQRFEAARVADRVVLTWEVLGDGTRPFRLWRAENVNGVDKTLLTPEPLLGDAEGAYRFVDATVLARSTYSYWLESIGDGELLGPRTASPQAGSGLERRAFMPLVTRR